MGLGALGLVGLLTSTVFAYDAAEEFWWALLILVAVVRLVMASNWRIGGRLSEEQQLFHEQAVPGLNAGQVRRRFKAWNRTVYNLTKSALVVAVAAALILPGSFRTYRYFVTMVNAHAANDPVRANASSVN